ncbi:hypothetical protein WHQ39_01275 [Campylobacter jejuni]
MKFTLALNCQSNVKTTASKMSNKILKMLIVMYFFIKLADL